MSTRTLIAAATLTIFAGAAAAEGESHIDYTNMYSSTTRAEVMSETTAFKNMHSGATFTASEAYGYIDPQLATSNTTRTQVMAEAVDARINSMSNQYFVVNEAYDGVPSLDINAATSSKNQGE
ncbi:MAG: hypothetical protein ABI564_07185 [Ideonella sp.]